MRSILASLSLLSLFALGGCAVDATNAPDDQSTSDSADEISTTKDSYVLLRADTRRCMAPLCGGYWVRTTGGTKETYVSGLDLSGSGLSELQYGQVTGAPANELLLKGKLGKADAKFGTHAFVVTTAWRGLPGVTPSSHESFFFAKDREPMIECFAAPCNNEIATRLGSSGEIDFTTLSVKRALKGFVDASWVSARVLRHGGIVSAKLVDGAKMGAGTEQVLDASQVYVRLPNVDGPCPKIMERLCDDGQILTHSRNAERCEIPGACVKTPICPLYMPHCEDGYTLAAWRAAPGGCFSYACDPSFLSE